MKPPAAFAADALANHDKVASVDVLQRDQMRIHRKDGSTLDVGVLSAKRVDFATAQSAMPAQSPPGFVMNIPKDAFWTGDAIDAVHAQGAAFGGLGELMSALNETDPGAYRKPEFKFVEDGLRQHQAVSGVNRLFDRVYEVRRSKGSLTVMLLNEYDVTADHVREALKRYGKFTDIVVTNPNGRVTANANTAASSAGVTIHKWGGLLSRLNRP